MLCADYQISKTVCKVLYANAKCHKNTYSYLESVTVKLEEIHLVQLKSG